MTKDAQVFNLLEGILPMVNSIRFFEPDDVLALMPASVFLLYEFWRSAKPTIFAWRLTIKSRPPIRFAAWLSMAINFDPLLANRIDPLAHR